MIYSRKSKAFRDSFNQSEEFAGITNKKADFTSKQIIKVEYFNFSDRLCYWDKIYKEKNLYSNNLKKIYLKYS